MDRKELTDRAPKKPDQTVTTTYGTVKRVPRAGRNRRGVLTTAFAILFYSL